jgi:hypothetical protein
LLESQLRLFGEQTGNRRLAGARRTPQDHALQTTACKHTRKRALSSDQLRLTDDICQGLGPQEISKRARSAAIQACCLK